MKRGSSPPEIAKALQTDLQHLTPEVVAEAKPLLKLLWVIRLAGSGEGELMARAFGKVSPQESYDLVACAVSCLLAHDPAFRPLNRSLLKTYEDRLFAATPAQRNWIANELDRSLGTGLPQEAPGALLDFLISLRQTYGLIRESWLVEAPVFTELLASFLPNKFNRMREQIPEEFYDKAAQMRRAREFNRHPPGPALPEAPRSSQYMQRIKRPGLNAGTPSGDTERKR